VLGLLAGAAEDEPLACLVDDAQWLDRASVQCLAFAARRLLAEPVALIFAARESGGDQDLAGLPRLTVTGLGDADARAVLASAVGGRLDARVADLIVAETRGNPLALLELPRGLGPAELAGGFGLPGAAPLAGAIEDSFARQLGALPDQTRRLLLLAAADPSGDRPLVWRAAGRLGLPAQAGAPAVEAGLVEFGAGAVPPSASPLGGVPVRVVLRTAADARGTSRGDRPGRGSRPPGLASGAGRGRAG
jgi:hypothetical protein